MKLDVDDQQIQQEKAAIEFNTLFEKLSLKSFFVWDDVFTERELRLISNCQTYAREDPAGLPGHNLMVIISKFCDALDRSQGL